MVSTERTLPNLALDDPEFYLGDVDASYTWLRAEAPVYWHEPATFWALSKYDDIRFVSRTPEIFSSERGITIDLRGGGESAAPSTIIGMDPPVHNQYRRLVSKAFTPRMVRELEPRIREITAETLDAVPVGEVVDFVEHVAVPLPMLVMAEMLGVPTSDRTDFRRWSDAIIDGEMDGVVELFSYFSEQLDHREQHPADDLMGRLLTAEIDGARLQKEEMLSFCMTLLVAGNETTRNLISGGALALAEHPDQRDRLRSNPDLLVGGVDEMLRWVTPVKTFARTAVQDTQIRGQEIAAGDYVVLLYTSANRDEEIWGPTASTFDVARVPDSPHLAFGWGEHACIGANLARLEAQVMFEQLLRRFSAFELTADPVRLRSTLINGIVEMPVIFH